jgi:lipopolysaccharide/colanic/teichoic acid biosynthesis glycosyltransferase
LENVQAVEPRNLISAEGLYAFPQARPQATTRPRRKRRVPSDLFRYRVIKRSLDVAAVMLAVPILAPIFFVLVCAAILTSPGPVFYSHRRIRQNGASFPMWKFRTMCVDSTGVLEDHLTRHPEARAEWNKTHKLRHDPRITPVGLFLRRYSIDELPQIWNVLIGQMSLVGPRPIVAAEIVKYRGTFNSYCRVKPGLTGLWQVSGRCTLTYDQRVALDRDYVEHWSLTRDLKILLKTLPSVLNRDGAF